MSTLRQKAEAGAGQVVGAAERGGAVVDKGRTVEAVLKT
jgi:hypothetical protein